MMTKYCGRDDVRRYLTSALPEAAEAWGDEDPVVNLIRTALEPGRADLLQAAQAAACARAGYPGCPRCPGGCWTEDDDPEPVDASIPVNHRTAQLDALEASLCRGMAMVNAGRGTREHEDLELWSPSAALIPVAESLAGRLQVIAEGGTIDDESQAAVADAEYLARAVRIAAAAEYELAAVPWKLEAWLSERLTEFGEEMSAKSTAVHAAIAGPDAALSDEAPSESVPAAL